MIAVKTADSYRDAAIVGVHESGLALKAPVGVAEHYIGMLDHNSSESAIEVGTFMFL